MDRPGLCLSPFPSLPCLPLPASASPAPLLPFPSPQPPPAPLSSSFYPSSRILQHFSFSSVPLPCLVTTPACRPSPRPTYPSTVQHPSSSPASHSPPFHHLSSLPYLAPPHPFLPGLSHAYLSNIPTASHCIPHNPFHLPTTLLNSSTIPVSFQLSSAFSSLFSTHPSLPFPSRSQPIYPSFLSLPIPTSATFLCPPQHFSSFHSLHASLSLLRPRPQPFPLLSFTFPPFTPSPILSLPFLHFSAFLVKGTRERDKLRGFSLVCCYRALRSPLPPPLPPPAPPPPR